MDKIVYAFQKEWNVHPVLQCYQQKKVCMRCILGECIAFVTSGSDPTDGRYIVHMVVAIHFAEIPIAYCSMSHVNIIIVERYWYRFPMKTAPFCM